MTEKHPYAELHSTIQREVMGYAEEYGIEEVEDRIWLRIDAILKAQNLDEASKLAKRARDVGLEFCIAVWSRKKSVVVDKPKPQAPVKQEVIKTPVAPRKIMKPPKQSTS